VATYVEGKNWRFVADMNGHVEDGYCAVPITSTKQHRVSTAMAYLGPSARARENLLILPETTVEKLVFDAQRAVGVTARRDRQVDLYRGARIILAAGALHTPGILQRAGIGPAHALAKLGIPVVADRPGVGANLQDHPCASIACHLKPQARQPKS